MPKVYIIIPAYNEERNINRVVNLCRRVCKANFRNFEILVIDDGSIDDTKIQAERAGAEVLVNPKNLGKGASLMHAFWWLLNAKNPKPNDLVVTIDSDLQHSPSDIPKLVSRLKEKNLDMTIGKRNLKSYPFYKRFGNRVLSLASSILTGKWFADGECGFRCIRFEKCVEMMRTINPQRYEYEIETNILAGLKNWKIEFVEIESSKYRSGVTVLNGIKNLWKGIKTWIKIKIL